MATFKITNFPHTVWVTDVTRVVDSGETVKRKTNPIDGSSLNEEKTFKLITVYSGEGLGFQEFEVLPGNGFLMEDGKTIDRI